MTRKHRKLTFLMAAGLLVSACASESTTSPSATPAPTPNIPYTNVWSTDPGIDLFSRGAELVRAAAEAGVYSQYVGVDGSYPGYAQAVAALTDEEERTLDPAMEQWVSRRPPYPANPTPGTIYQHITAYSASDTKVSAIVCSYGVDPDPKPPQPKQDYFGGGLSIELEIHNWDKGNPGIANPDPDHHDPRAQRPPRWNVFDRWKVTKISSATAGERPECLSWYQQKFPSFAKDPKFDRLLVPAGYVWPHQPVAQQFPEWIGPSAN